MRIVLAVLLLAHGIAHLPGFLVSWQLRSFPEMPYRTTVLGGSVDIGDGGIKTIGRASVVRKILLVGGVLSSLLYVIAIDVVAALRHPDYHDYADQMVSELFAAGAPTRTLMVWLMIPYNLLVFALAAGVWASAGGTRARRSTAAAIAGYGVVSTAGLWLFPMDVRGTVDSQRDFPHIVATILMSIFIVVTMAFGAFVHGKRFRIYSFATIATVIVFGAWAGFLAGPMPGPTPWLGIAERVNIYATMLWVAIMAKLLV